MKFLGKTKVFSIIFYVFAALFCLYTLFVFFTTMTNVNEIVSSGLYQVGFSDILGYYVTNVGPYLVYTLLLFFCGYAIDLLGGNVVPEAKEKEVKEVEKAYDKAVKEEPKEDAFETYEQEPTLNQAVEPEVDEESTEKLNELEEKIAEAIDDSEDTVVINDVELENEEDK